MRSLAAGETTGECHAWNLVLPREVVLPVPSLQTSVLNGISSDSRHFASAYLPVQHTAGPQFSCVHL